jgi:flagellar hook-associated protein 2
MPEFRIPGLASGMDMNENVTNLMKAESEKLKPYESDKQILEWQQTQYNSVIETYTDFVLNSRETFGFENNYVGHVVADTDDFLLKTASSSNQNISVTANSAASTGTQSIEVVQKAEGASLISTDSISSDSAATNLVDRFNLGDVTSKFISFTIENGAGETKEFDFTDLANTSLDSIITEVNDSDMGVKLNYDSTLDRVFIQTSGTGEDSIIKITQGTSTNASDVTNSVDFLVRDPAGTNLLKLDIEDAEVYTGKNAIIKYNGAGDQPVSNIEYQSNSFSLNNVNYNISNATAAEVVTVTISENSEGIAEKVQAFVDNFNQMATFTYGKMTEVRDSSKDPLTDDDREKMTESQIDEYEKKAQKGLISGDSQMSSIHSQLRLTLSEQVYDGGVAIGSLASIGITTTRDKAGTIEIDQGQLVTAINEDPEKVMKILFKQPEVNEFTNETELDAAEIETRREESGIFNRMSDIIAGGLIGLVNKAGRTHESSLREFNANIITQTYKFGSVSIIDTKLKYAQEKIEELETYLEEKETYYWNSFAKMESAMSELNSQLMWLENQSL